MNKKVKPVILISTQRSGTNFFRLLLESNGSIKNCQEIFNTCAFGREYAQNHYHPFLIRMVQENPEYLVPNKENQEKLFDLYLDFLASLAEDFPFFMIDIKYNSLHMLDTAWRSPLEAPYIFSIIKKLELPVIHLTRKNLFNVYLSRQVVNLTKKFTLKHDEVLELPKVTLKAEDVIESLKLLEAEQNKVKSHLLDIPKKIDIFYEDFQNINDSFPVYIHTALEQLLDTVLQKKMKSPLKKIIPSQSEVIENYEQVKEFLSKAGYGHYLDKI